MKIETNKLIGKALDYAVAIAKGAGTVYIGKNGKHCLATARYSTDWSAGGPIIERERISMDQFSGHPCRAFIGTQVRYECAMFAPEGQPLVAAMRCYVAGKLGDSVEIPDELTK